MTNQYQIEKLEDIIDIPDASIPAFLKDLEIWVKMMKDAKKMLPKGIEMLPRMIWVDDGQTGMSDINIITEVRQ